MFTLKFFNFYEDGGSSMTVISTPHYQVYERPNGVTTISTYKGMTLKDGVDRHLAHPAVAAEFCKDGKFYHESCFVENADGKTINNIRPLEPKAK